MTTAHRPTWKAAVGRAQEGGWSSGGAISTQSSSRDLASHTKLKFRQGPQQVRPSDRVSALQQSLLKMKEEERKAELSAKRAVKMGRERLLLENEEKNEEEGRLKLLKQTADVDEEQIRAKYDDEDDDNDDGGGAGRWSDLDDDGGGGINNLQSDESDLDASDDDSDLDDDDDSDDEDEEAALQAELAKIRQERAAAKSKEEAEAAALEQAQMEEAALTGNPLLNNSGGGQSASSSFSGRLKRRWNDDVVFRNQAKTEPDQNKKRFINDTVRNDFHKRFLDKFIK
jgi:protein CWC15